MTSRSAPGYSLVLVLVLVIACGQAPTPPIAPTETATQTTGGSSAVNEVSAAAPEEAPVEPPPVEPTDIFAEDLAQTPSWGRFANPQWNSIRNVARQIPNPAAELDAAAALGPGFVGVLICEVEVTEQKNWDSPGLFRRHVEPDIILLGGSRSTTLLQVMGPEDTYAFVASYPNVQLDHGFVLHVRDHDTNQDDRIESLTVPAPTEQIPFIEVAGERSRARCAGVPVMQAAERAQASFDALEPLLTRLEARAPVGADQASRQLEPARRHARSAAAWLGWSHPSVMSVVQRLEAVAGLWAIADAETRAAPIGTESQMSRVVVSVLDHTCSEGVCQARVRATYTGIGPVVSLTVLSPAGEVVTTEVASDPVRPFSARTQIHGRDSTYTHTFEWAGETANFATIRQRNDEVLVRLQ